MHCLRFEKKDEQLSRWQSFMATRGRTRVLFIFFLFPYPLALVEAHTVERALAL